MLTQIIAERRHVDSDWRVCLGQVQSDTEHADPACEKRESTLGSRGKNSLRSIAREELGSWAITTARPMQAALASV
jgi:hypothetical protein